MMMMMILLHIKTSNPTLLRERSPDAKRQNGPSIHACRRCEHRNPGPGIQACAGTHNRCSFTHQVQVRSSGAIR